MKKIGDVLLGARIRKIRNDMGYDQKQFSEKIGSTVSALSNWENGRNKPKDNTLNKIAELAGIPVNELLYGSFESYAFNKITEFIQDEDSHHYVLNDETKKEIVDIAVKQSLTNALAYPFFGIGEFETVDNELKYEMMAALRRKFNNTEFTNRGVIRYSSNELSIIVSGLKKYLDNGVDKSICSDIKMILNNADKEISTLYEKHRNKLN